MKIFDKKLTVLFLFFAMGCHGGGNNGPAVVADQSASALAAVTPDPTLGCQKPFGDPVKETSYADMIDGQAGTYKLIGSAMYLESQPASKDNVSLLFEATNFGSESYKAASEDLDPSAKAEGANLTSEQSVSCKDLSKLNGQTLERKSVIPFEISRVDGKVASGIMLFVHADDDNKLQPITNALYADPELPDLQSMVQAKANHHLKKVRFARVSKDEVHVFFEDKFINHKNDKGIIIVEGIYRLSI